MFVVQMLTTEGDVPDVYGLTAASLTKEIHAWLRGDTNNKKAERAYDAAKVKLHSEFNDGTVILRPGTILRAENRAPVGTFVGALLYRDRD
jgi:hypothetical protein